MTNEDLREVARLCFTGRPHVGTGITKAPQDRGDLWCCTLAYELLRLRQRRTRRKGTQKPAP